MSTSLDKNTMTEEIAAIQAAIDSGELKNTHLELDEKSGKYFIIVEDTNEERGSDNV
jgi:hypothetical protein